MIKKRWHQPWFGGGIGATLAAMFGLCLLLLPIGKALRDWSYDLPFVVMSEKLVDDVLVIHLDEASFEALNQEPSDFDPALHARLIQRLQAEGAKLIVFDILFIDAKRSRADANQELAAAMRKSGRVVIGGEYQEDRHLGIRGFTTTPPSNYFAQTPPAGGWRKYIAT